jgi:hypothetical protein
VFLHEEDGVPDVGGSAEENDVVLIATVRLISPQDRELPNPLSPPLVGNGHASFRAPVIARVVGGKIGSLYDLFNVRQILGASERCHEGKKDKNQSGSRFHVDLFS